MCPYSAYTPDDELINAICENRCILFVGAGLSMQAKRRKPIDYVIDSSSTIKTFVSTPSWEELLKIILYNSGMSISPDWLDDIEYLFEKGQYLTVAEEILQVANKTLVKDIFKEFFDSSLYHLSKTHDLLPEIPFRAVITTNYDNFLNTSYGKRKSRVNVFSRKNVANAFETISPAHKRDDKFFIFNMHGDFEDDFNHNGIVLGSQSFQDVMFNTPGYRQFLETIFTVYTVLFVGFSGNDPHLTNILDRIASITGRKINTHYLFIEKNTFNEIERRRWEEDRRVRVLNYENKSKIHEEVLKFFEYLRLQIDVIGCDSSAKIFQETRIKLFLSHSKFTKITFLLIKRLSSASGIDFRYDTYFLQDDNIGNENPDQLTQKEREEISDLILWRKVAQSLREANFIVFLWDQNAPQSWGMKEEINYALYWSKIRPLKLLILRVDQTPIPTYLTKIPRLDISSEKISIEIGFVLEEIYRLANGNVSQG